MRNIEPINHFPPTLFSPNRSPIIGEAHLFSQPASKLVVSDTQRVRLRPVSTSETTGTHSLATPSAEVGDGRRVFVTTHWSVVLSARKQDSPQSAAALEALCRTYWYPLYAYVRRQGHSPHDSQDLTQEFFARLLQKDYLKAALREKGRFRTFLIVALKRFLANEWTASAPRNAVAGRHFWHWTRNRPRIGIGLNPRKAPRRRGFSSAAGR